MKKKLTPKQDLFVDAYVGPANFSGTEAYKVAFKTSQNAGKRAYRMLQSEHIKQAIQERLEERKRTFFYQEADVLEGLYKEAQGSVEDSTQAGRIQAWTWLGKHLGMFGTSKEDKSETNQFTIINYNDGQRPQEKIIEAAAELPVEEIKQIGSFQDTLEIEIDD